MRTLYASSSIATARYYTQYLDQAPGEVPGEWTGQQATALELSGTVKADDLQVLLDGRDPTTGVSLGNRLVDRQTSKGKTIRAVAGLDATFSAPKAVSVWWALTGDPGLLAAHDMAVAAVLEHVERFGSTTRIRVNGQRAHPDTAGLTMAAFRQTTSREDDPQLHTHTVISAKVQTADGRWLALDARYLKRNQRMLGGMYQSVLRSELTHRFGVAWEPIVKGQAEITGVATELLEVFSKRAGQVAAALEVKVEEFRGREGRDPTRWEKAAMTREAAADTRAKKTGHDVTDLRAQWIGEAAEIGWTPERLVNEITAIARQQSVSRNGLTIEEVTNRLSASGSTWTPADVLGAICDLVTVEPSMPGRRWVAALDRASQQVIGTCEDIDPAGNEGGRRESDGRSIWMEPTALHLTSTTILAQEEQILTWAMNAQADDPNPSTTINRDGLDVLQADAAAAVVAGADWLVVVVGPAGTGKTTMLARAVEDLHVQGRPVFGVAPTAKAARVLGAETGIGADTAAKLLHEWARTDRSPDPHYRLPGGATVIADKAGIIGTASLHELVGLAQDHDWRLVLVGDPRQLQAVGRGGMFNELCATSRAFDLARIHRFHQPWEAAASLQLRAGNTKALDAYEAHGRITAGLFDDHLTRIADQWIEHTAAGKTVAITAATNGHVDAINHAVQQARFRAGQLSDRSAAIGCGEQAHEGDVIATRRNDRSVHTTTGEPVRNRDLWTVTAIHPEGDLTVSHNGGHRTARLPAGYAAEHVRLGYAATEHGNQADTVDIGIGIVSSATTHSGLYVGMTRGRDTNQLLVVTDTADITEARDVVEGVLAHDRADIPAVRQRRELAQQLPPAAPARTPAPQPRLAIPEWFGRWRTGLEHRRQELVQQIAGRADRRTQAAADLASLQPAIAAARVAWRPYQQPIDQLEDELRTVLRPAMWKANAQARAASFGRRHSAARHAAQASQRVTDTQARTDVIEAEGRAVKARLDALEGDGRALHQVAHPPEVLAHFEDFDQRLLDIFDRQLNAVDTYLALADGHSVGGIELAQAMGELADVARLALYHPLDPDQISRTEWAELLDPITQLLWDRGIELGVDQRLERRHPGPELGL